MELITRELSRRLEHTEGECGAAFAEARAAAAPDSGATWLEVAGARVVFDGAASPLTQTFGLGLPGDVIEVELAAIEGFFRERQAPVLHEISPLADPGLLPLLVRRGYHPLELTSVLFRELSAASAPAVDRSTRLHVRVVAPTEAELWARTSARGWASEAPELEAFLLEFGQIGVRTAGMVSFLAELDGAPVATGALYLGTQGVAFLGGASTVPESRRQGAQAALLAARLHYAAGRGYTLASMGAAPGSQSQHNAEKAGFRVAYTRTKWQLE